MNPLLKIPEVAAALNVGRSTVYKLIATGELATVKMGRSVRIPPDEIQRFVASHTSQPRTPTPGWEERMWAAAQSDPTFAK